jgi:hypothetical protein
MKKLDDNIFNALFHKLANSRKPAKQEEEDELEPEMDEDLKRLEQKKRARYEALKEKYKD